MPDGLELKVLKVVRDHLDACADDAPDPQKPGLTMCVELLDAVLAEGGPVPAPATPEATA